MTSEEREKLGRCASDLVLDPSDPSNGKNDGQGKYFYTFVRAPAGESLPGFSAGSEPSREAGQKTFLKLSLHEGDAVVVSEEAGKFAISLGFIQQVRPFSITVRLDRPLCPEKSSNGFGDAKAPLSASRRATARIHRRIEYEADLPGTERYRLDKDESMANAGTARSHVLRLFTRNGNERQRKLLVDLDVPRFRCLSSIEEDGIAKLVCKYGLNGGQKRAVERVLTGKL
jgi:DNA replication ATP-dependent helicase Dna2